MKIIYCYKCGCKVGIIRKGAYKKGAKGVCEECIDGADKIKIADDLKNIGSNEFLNSLKSMWEGVT